MANFSYKIRQDLSKYPLMINPKIKRKLKREIIFNELRTHF